MTTRVAACACGQLRITCEGEPIRVSVCHCLDCKRRTGSAFGVQARFDRALTHTEGTSAEFIRVADSGNPVTFRFCPTCGSTVFYMTGDGQTIAVAVGAFADPGFPEPVYTVYEDRQHPWVRIETTGPLERHR